MNQENSKVETVRLHKFMADCGVASRRASELMILQGKVTVNGKQMGSLGVKVHPYNDLVEVEGKPLNLMAVDKHYIILNKPRGVVTTVNDPEGRSTVIDYLKGFDARVFPVGRLDFNSEGLLILTNDGELANMIMHPKYEVTKVYEVKVFGMVSEGILRKLAGGFQFPDGFIKPKSVRVIETLPNKTWIEFTLCEGKNREIRRLCEAAELTVDKLRRVAIEGLHIQNLPTGHFTMMTKKELLKALGINEDGSKKIAPRFVSHKKSIRLKDNILRHHLTKTEGMKPRMADDKVFQKYRKEKYRETIEIQMKITAESEDFVQTPNKKPIIGFDLPEAPKRRTSYRK